MRIENHLKVLGFRAKDKVTGFKGVITSVSFDLYGCIQAVLNPGLDKDGKFGDQAWFDIARLQIENKIPVMPCPDFGNVGSPIDGKKGPAEKPAFTKF